MVYIFGKLLSKTFLETVEKKDYTLLLFFLFYLLYILSIFNLAFFTYIVFTYIAFLCPEKKHIVFY